MYRKGHRHSSGHHREESGGRRNHEAGHHRRRSTGRLNEREEHIRNLKAHIVRLGNTWSHSSLLVIWEKTGDKTTTKMEADIEELVKTLESEIDTYTTELTDTIVHCIKGLSMKAPLYGAFIGLLYSKKPSFVQKLMKRVAVETCQSIERNEFLDARSLLRFMVETVNCNVLTVQSIITFFRSILKVPLDCKSQVPTCNKDIFVYLVLASFPWVSHRLSFRSRIHHCPFVSFTWLCHSFYRRYLIEQKSDGVRCNPGTEEFEGVWRDLEDYFAQRPTEREAPTIMYVIKPKDDKSLEGWKDEVRDRREEDIDERRYSNCTKRTQSIGERERHTTNIWHPASGSRSKGPGRKQKHWNWRRVITMAAAGR